MAGSPGSGREAHRSETGNGERLTTTIRAAVEYDGARFFGFQFQPTVRSVAGELERALSSLLQEPVKITGAGRTDTGVHASGQVISFSTARSFPFERLAIAANSALPDDVSLRDVAIVDSSFSARFSARSRTYVYAILHRKDRSALLAHRAYHVYGSLDLERMREGGAHLVGEHDFRSFCGMLPEGGVTIRNVQSLEITESGDYVRVQISAD